MFDNRYTFLYVNISACTEVLIDKKGLTRENENISFVEI